jgi:hypothetical protein
VGRAEPKAGKIQHDVCPLAPRYRVIDMRTVTTSFDKMERAYWHTQDRTLIDSKVKLKVFQSTERGPIERVGPP